MTCKAKAQYHARMKKVLLTLAVALFLAAPAQAQRQERSSAKPVPQPQKAGGRDDMRRERFSRQERDRLRQDLIDANRDMKGRK